jgi:hypothetical protein
MKKVMSCLLCIILTISFTACGSAGNTDSVSIDPIKSSIYSEDDYTQAVNVALKYFHNHFTDCTMTKISYVGDDMGDAMKEWAEDYHMDEVIILTSDFKTGKHCEKSLDPNSKYTDWQWILARNKGGKWKHKDHGYG